MRNSHCDWIHRGLFTFTGKGSGSALIRENTMTLRMTPASDWPLPSWSELFAVVLLVGFLGGSHLLGAVQERAQRHPAEHVSMGLFYKLDQLADVAVQSLRRQSKSEIDVRMRNRVGERSYIQADIRHLFTSIQIRMNSLQLSSLDFIKAPVSACGQKTFLLQFRLKPSLTKASHHCITIYEP